MEISQAMRFMGKTIVAYGGPDMGLTAKLCNNYHTTEAINISIRAGMDPYLLARMFTSSTVGKQIKYISTPSFY